MPVALGMVSHIDDDHINGIQKLTDKLVAARPGLPARSSSPGSGSIRSTSFGPKPAGAPAEAATASLQSLSGENLPGVDDEHAQAIMQSVPQGKRWRLLAGTGGQRARPRLGDRQEGPTEIRDRRRPGDGARSVAESARQAARGMGQGAPEADQEARQAALQSLFLPPTRWTSPSRTCHRSSCW